MRTILTTTGTSLLTNTARELNKKAASVTDEELRHFFEQVGAAKASAETNSLLKIAEKDDEIVLLYTTTIEGERCAKIVQQYLQNQNWKFIRLVQLPLEQNEAQFERHGLRELVNILVDEITKATNQGREVIINATGGFKAEIAYTTMVGMIFQVPVKYIYQDFSQPINFPVLPITWNIDFLLEYEPFFKWITSDYRTQLELEQRLKAIPDRERILGMLLPPDVDNYIFLSPAGEILWRRVIQQQQAAEIVAEPSVSEIPISEKISSSVKSVKHHYPQGTLKFAENLAQLAFVESVIGGHFENTTMRRIKSVNDDGSIRLLWADNQKAVNITVQTTARGQVQTLKVCDFIRPLLDA
ncbi:MAG: putative CRISPR-associated protein [Nostoc sp.]|uniref:putative CRISPR-associated protein n=1 Tax=Nostoc sp. TaxID=1180 RepID=UPI002FF62FFA